MMTGDLQDGYFHITIRPEDRFASWETTQLKRYNSQFGDPQSEAVDAFSQDWKDENNYLCPPFRTIPRVLRHLMACADVTLIAPIWPAQHWFSTLLQISKVHPGSQLEVLVQDGPIGLRGAEEEEVENRSIPDIWISHITTGWSSEASSLLRHSLAGSTFKGYNQELERYFDFCRKQRARWEQS